MRPLLARKSVKLQAKNNFDIVVKAGVKKVTKNRWIKKRLSLVKKSLN